MVARSIHRMVHWVSARFRRLDLSCVILIRLYLAPLFWVSGTTKLMHIQPEATWLGNADRLGLPYPIVLRLCDCWAEVFSSICLVLGFAVRWVCLPLTVIVMQGVARAMGAWLVLAGPSWHRSVAAFV